MLRVNVCTARLASLSYVDAMLRFSKKLTIDIDRKALAGVDMVTPANDKTIAVPNLWLMIMMMMVQIQTRLKSQMRILLNNWT